MTITLNSVAEDEGRPVRRRLAKIAHNACSGKTVKKRLPITDWLPKYDSGTLLQDFIAGITVGLTAIPQGIAYAVVAGLSPEYGLYSGLLGGFIYLVFGSCKDITVGPTAVMSAMVAKYVANYSTDFAVLAAFLSGIVILLMGILNLGFLVDFISTPVIKGFTMSAAIQIAASQLKSLLGLSGNSGNYFAESMYNFFRNVKTAKLWDPVLGFSTIALLFALKNLGAGCKRTDKLSKSTRWFISLARNAIVVILGMIIAYTLEITVGVIPVNIIGEIGSGLPDIKLPPMSTTVRNETYEFQDMLKALGPQSIVLPLVAILESVAIAKAFSGGKLVDATQEMIALGLCNIIGSFISSMPVTGSFTRTALNHASGVRTTAGGIFTCSLIFLALSLLTTSFAYIPRASLAGLIVAAMASMIEREVFGRLWRTSKREFFVLILTMAVSLMFGLEYGIVTGAVFEALCLFYNNARPKVDVTVCKIDDSEVLLVSLNGNVSYCAAEHFRTLVMKVSRTMECTIIVDGTALVGMDTTVATNMTSLCKDLENSSKTVLFLNFRPDFQNMLIEIYPKTISYFVQGQVEDCVNMKRNCEITLCVDNCQKLH